jgi:hypothetical protein
MSHQPIAAAACALVLFVLAGAQAEPASDQPWRAKFDEAYALAKGQSLRHVPPPFIPERLEFYRWAAKSQAEAMPEGPASMTVRWAGENPRFGGARFGGGGEGLTLRLVLEQVVGLKPHEYDGPRELLDLELPGDWAVRYRAKPPEMLNDLAARLREITAQNLSFERAKKSVETIVARGMPKPPADLPANDTWPLRLDVEEVEFLRPFGGAGPIAHLLDTLGRASGWPVINETEQAGARQMVSWSGSRVTEEENLERTPRDQLDMVIQSIAKQTGLELAIESREIERWTLWEKP